MKQKRQREPNRESYHCLRDVDYRRNLSIWRPLMFMPHRALTGIAKPILDNARSNPSCFETIQIWPINITHYGYTGALPVLTQAVSFTPETGHSLAR